MEPATNPVYTTESEQEHADALLRDAAIEVRSPDGGCWRVGLDGSVSGFPPGSSVLNAALPAVWALLGKAQRQSVGVSGKQGDSAVSG